MQNKNKNILMMRFFLPPVNTQYLSQCISEFNVHLPPKLLENGAAVVRASYQVTLERLCANAHSSSTAKVKDVPSSSSFSFEIVVSRVFLHLSHSCRVTGPHTDFLLSALGDAHFTRHSLPQRFKLSL